MSPSRPPAPRPAPTRRATPASPTPVARPPVARSPFVPSPAPPAASGGPPVARPSPAPRPSSAAKPPVVPATTAPTPRAAAPTTSRTTYEVRRFRGPVRPAVVSTRSAERFAERARAARNLARRQIALVAGGVLVVLGLGYLVLLSPVFALKPAKTTVTGAGTVVAVSQVMAVVDEHAGTPLPRLDVGRLRAEVLEVPGVRDVTVSRDWPQGLTIALVSREPVAAVPEKKAPAGKAKAGFALLDEDGVQVGRVDAAPKGLPVVTVPVAQARTLQAVLSVLQQLPSDLVAQVGGVSAKTQDTITMTLRDGVTVDWGSADETALKAAVVKALRASPVTKGVHTIDVSAPRLPITK